MPRGIFQRHGPVGFLKPQHRRVVQVESVGVVYEGRNQRESERVFRRWQKFSEAPIGRASGKKIVLITDDKITKIYEPN